MRIFKSEMKELKADDAVDTKKNDDSSEK
jgi:hypothetical protein